MACCNQRTTTCCGGCAITTPSRNCCCGGSVLPIYESSCAAFNARRSCGKGCGCNRGCNCNSGCGCNKGCGCGGYQDWVPFTGAADDFDSVYTVGSYCSL